MPGPLINGMHERFAQELAKGRLQLEAYLDVGYKGGKAQACRLAAKQHIRARMEEIQKRAAKRAEITVADIAMQLDEDREFARRLEVPAAAVSATMGKAKVLGLIVDKTRVDLTGTITVVVSQDDAAL